MKLLVSVYKTAKKEGMYLYVLKSEQMKKVPDGLQALFGQPLHIMDFILSPERKLAHVSTENIIEALHSTGYYLQMPPSQDDYIEHLPDELLTMNDPV